MKTRGAATSQGSPVSQDSLDVALCTKRRPAQYAKTAPHRPCLRSVEQSIDVMSGHYGVSTPTVAVPDTLLGPMTAASMPRRPTRTPATCRSIHTNRVHGKGVGRRGQSHFSFYLPKKKLSIMLVRKAFPADANPCRHIISPPMSTLS